jgi:hypothetical protein
MYTVYNVMRGLYTIQAPHYRIPGILSANSLVSWMLITYCSWGLNCGDSRIGYIGIRSANPLTLENFYGLLLWTAYNIGPISADQHKQIGIQGGARSFQLRGGFMKQNGNFEKSQELKGRPEKFNNQ